MPSPASTLPPSFHQWQAWRREGVASVLAQWRRRVGRARTLPGWDSAIAWEPAERALAETWAASPAEAPLAGVPWALKDLFDVGGLPTAASSRFLAEERPVPPADAAVVRALGAAGAVLVAKTHLNEFAYGLDGVNPHTGTVPNPRVPGHLAGGSSSGSAWAVAARLVPLAVGTDTGGSIRVPAAYCGLFGFRLTPEHPWSREGCFPLAPRFDTAGWFTARASEMDAVLALVDPAAGASPESTGRIEGLDLCAATEGLATRLSTAIALGIQGISRPAGRSEREAWRGETRDLVPAYNILQSRDAWAVHRPWWERRQADYDPVVRARLARAERWTARRVEEAEELAERWRGTLAHWVATHRFLVLPTVPTVAPAIAEGMPDEARAAVLALTVPASLAGFPVLSLPVGQAPHALTAVQVVLPRALGEAIPLARAIVRTFAAANRLS